MKFVLHPEAANEIKQTTAFYKKQQAGLEKRFIEALEEGIEKSVCLSFALSNGGGEYSAISVSTFSLFADLSGATRTGGNYCVNAH